MRFRILTALILAVWGLPVYVVSRAQPPTPSPQSPQVNPAPVQPPAKHHHPRGAKSSRHHWLAHEATNHPKFKHFARAGTPASYLPPIPSQLSMWGNSTFGDCVSAEEAFKLAMNSVLNGYPEVFVPEQTVVQWAAAGGYLNGADLTSVMDSMAKSGMTASDGKTYTDGPYTSVNYPDWATLTSAISSGNGPVKIGVASSQFDNVNGVGTNNGWIMVGFRPDQSEDHCVSLFAYGTMQQMCDYFKVAVPSGVDPTSPALGLFTWSTVGIIAFQSMTDITGEAWLRSPATPQDPPNPNPVPTPPPPNPPPPGPNPAGWSGTITVQNGVATQVNPAVAPTPAPAAWSGTITITNGIITGVAAPTFHAPAPPPATGGHRASVVIPPDWHRRQATGPAVTIHPQIRAVDVPADWDVTVQTAATDYRDLNDPLPLNTALIRLEAKESRERDRRNAEWFAEKYGWRRGNFERDALTAVGAN